LFFTKKEIEKQIPSGEGATKTCENQ